MTKYPYKQNKFKITKIRNRYIEMHHISYLGSNKAYATIRTDNWEIIRESVHEYNRNENVGLQLCFPSFKFALYNGVLHYRWSNNRWKKLVSDFNEWEGGKGYTWVSVTEVKEVGPLQERCPAAEGTVSCNEAQTGIED